MMIEDPAKAVKQNFCSQLPSKTNHIAVKLRVLLAHSDEEMCGLHSTLQARSHCLQHVHYLGSPGSKFTTILKRTQSIPILKHDSI